MHALIALAAWRTDRPVRAVWTRPESMAASPKRHPSRITATAGADAAGRLTAYRFHGDFDTGAYASWGPTVANRVPVHAMGPYGYDAVLATTRAVYSNNPPAGAFRGFGVPQASIAHEALMDDLAAQLGHDPLEFRLANALRAGSTTAERPAPRRERRPARLPRGAPAALGSGSAPTPPPTTPRPTADAPSGPDGASGSGPCGTASATPRSPTRRRSRWA